MVGWLRAQLMQLTQVEVTLWQRTMWRGKRVAWHVAGRGLGRWHISVRVHGVGMGMPVGMVVVMCGGDGWDGAQ